MKKIKLGKKALFGAVLAIILIVIGIGAVNFYKRPLGPALETSSHSSLNETGLIEATPKSSAAKPPAPTNATTTGEEKPSTSTPPISDKEEPVEKGLPETQVEICGETAVWNVLALGSDASDQYYPQGSDLTRVLRVDFQNKTVKIFAFSRDLWVDTGNLNLADPSPTHMKLGMVFYEASLFSAKEDPQDSFQDGINAIAQTLATNFGVNSDHYIALDLDKLPDMIDTVGGVTINIPAALTDPKSGMVFSAGEQTLNGLRTATYARAYLDTDLNRIERTNLLVMAMRQKLLEPAVWIKLPELYLQFRDAVITDFNLEQVNHLACLLKEVGEEAIIQEGVKVEWTTPGPENSLLWDKTIVLNKLKGLGMIP